MARLERMPEDESKHLRALPCPTYETTPWVVGPALAERRLPLSPLPDSSDVVIGLLPWALLITGSFPPRSKPMIWS